MPTGSPTHMKPCKVCGELFLPEKPSSKICSREHYIACPICGQLMLWNTTRKAEPCSSECRKEYRRLENLRKYGCEHPMQNPEVQAKHKASMLEKYGVESPLQSEEIKGKAIASNQAKFGCDWALGSKDVKRKSMRTMTERYGASTTLASPELTAKVKSTMVERYGVETAAKSEICVAKKMSTNLARYGVSNPMQNAEIAAKSAAARTTPMHEIIEKCKATWLATIGVDNPSKSAQVIDKITDTFLTRYGVKRAVDVPEFREKMQQSMVERYGVPYYYQSEEFKNSDHFKVSKINKEFSEALKVANIPNSLELPLCGKSFDIALEDEKTLIEIDPTYTHNIIGNHWNKSGLSSDYHKLKTQIAIDNGYRCLHIFDWDNKDKIIQMLAPKKRIYARKCELWKLTTSATTEFLNKYHLQGTCRGQLLCIGLVQDGEIYQVMTFGKSRYDKQHNIELLRLCTKAGYMVVGGAEKLFSYAIKYYSLENIISYCDRSKFTGEVYERLGMKQIRVSAPQEVWSKGTQKITANLLRQRGYDQLFNTQYGKGISNEQLMLEHGWLPVHDCGQTVFEY